MLVGAVVVDDQVDIGLERFYLADLAQEAQELFVAVPGLAFGDHRTRGHIQCRKQGCGAVADVVVGDAQRVAQTHGQHRLGPVQGLGLLVNAEHDCLVWRVEVEPDGVADLLSKEGIVGELE